MAGVVGSGSVVVVSFFSSLLVISDCLVEFVVGAALSVVSSPLEPIAGLEGGLGESTIMGETSELFTFKRVFRLDFLGSAGTTLVLLGTSVPEAMFEFMDFLVTVLKFQPIVADEVPGAQDVGGYDVSGSALSISQQRIFDQITHQIVDLNDNIHGQAVDRFFWTHTAKL